MSETNDTQRKSALVTGSSRGIGLAVASELAQAGYNVCLNCSSERGLAALQEHADALAARYGVQTLAVAASVGNADEASALVSAAHKAFGRLDVLVNNAGITHDGLMVRMKEEDFDNVINVNLKGTFLCCKAAGQIMMKRRYGRIINMSSISGIGGNAGQVNYAASKAGVVGMTKSLAKELASRGVTVNAVAPGFIETDMTAAMPQAAKDAMMPTIPMQRLGAPEDVAKAVAFLASDEAAYVTGQVLAVDGGMAM